MSAFPSIEQLRKLSAEGLSPEGYGGGYVKIRPEGLDALLDVVEAAQEMRPWIGEPLPSHVVGHGAESYRRALRAYDDALARFTREES